jgi:hypothetical protein
MIAAGPLALWVARNMYLTGTLTGARAEGHYFNLGESIYYASHILSVWLVPIEIPYGLRVWILLGVFTIAAIFLMVLIWKRPDVWRECAIKFLPIFVFFLFYTIFIVFYTAVEKDYNVSDRLLSPVYVPWIFILFWVVDKMLTIPKRNGLTKILTEKILVVLISFWVLYGFVRITEKMTNIFENGSGEFSTTRWRESPLLVWLANNPLEGHIYSNVAEAVYILTRQYSGWLPRRDHCPSAEFQGNLDQFMSKLPNNRDSYFIYFDHGDGDCFLLPSKIPAGYGLKEYQTFSDGVIFIRKANEKSFRRTLK